MYKTNFGQNKPIYNNNNHNNNNYNKNNGRSERLPAPEPMSVQSRPISRPWQRESFNTQEQQTSSSNSEPQDNSKIIETSFLELGRIDIDENY